MKTDDKIQYNWRSFDADCKKIAKWAKSKNFSNIYGIPRGGLVVAVRVSHFTNMPVVLNHKDITPKTLVVDDISDSGKTLKKLRGLIKIEPAVATLFWHKDSSEPSFWCREKSNWVVFPWETKITSKYDNTLDS